MIYSYSDLDAKFSLWWMREMPAPESEPCEDAIWWTPDGLRTWDEVQTWYAEETYRNCPYFIASQGGPKDLPGRYGPGTCGGGCWDEPRCLTG